MKLKQPFLLLAALIVGIGMSAQTSVIDNLATSCGASCNPDMVTATTRWYAQSFVMGSEGGTVNDLTIQDAYNNPAEYDGMYLYSADGSGEIGSQVLSFTRTGNSAGQIYFSPDATYVLQPSTKYWLVATQNNTLWWQYTNSNSLTGTCLASYDATNYRAKSTDQGSTWVYDAAVTNYAGDPSNYGTGFWVFIFKLTVTDTFGGGITWEGSTNTDWNTNSNWSGSSVPTSSDNVTISSSASNWPSIDNSLSSPALCSDLTIETGAEMTILDNAGLSVSGDITNNGTFNINSSASGEGSLLVSGSLSGTGTYNVQRYLSGSQWHLVSSPITNGVAGVFQDIWLRPYDESTNNFGEYIQPYQTPMPTGQGFSVWADANETRTFTGTINHGSIGALSLQLTGAAGPNTGWNLMGNPYPSSIDWDAASGWLRTNIADAVYVWNSSQYSAYVGGIPVNGGSRYIAPGQGFFLQATNVGASVTMDNGIRLHNSVSFLKNTQSDPENTIRVQVSADGYQDENVIVIREADAFAYDPLVDAYKLPGSADAPQMHIEKDDFSELSIASFPHIQDTENKSLNIDYALEGTHSLLWAHTCTENSPALIDQQTGQIIEPGSIYTFTASFSDMEDRFVFETDLLSIQDKLKELDVWEYNNTVFVKSNTNESQISVINMQGVEVYSNTGNIFNLNHLSPAMYVVKVKSGEQTRIEKIVIK